tara:strand:+ start:249 stop:437 length:189 start_codon:yes stop_codon:yes gene_type:complete
MHGAANIGVALNPPLVTDAAKVRKEPILTDAAPGSKGIYVRYAHVFFHVALYAPTILKGPQS